jgi:hypothetical protein
MTNDTLFSLTPSSLTDTDYLRRYRAAEAVAAALGEPIDHHLRDWSPAHINRFRELAKIEQRTTHTPGPWNARLIAAAPDLLAIVAELARYDGMSGDLPMLILKARATLASFIESYGGEG